MTILYRGDVTTEQASVPLNITLRKALGLADKLESSY